MATTNRNFKVKNGLDVNSNATIDSSGNANLVGATFTANVAGTNISLSGNVNANTVNATTFIGSGASLTSIPNSATTANSANGVSTIVARDVNGSFAGNVITATTFSGSGTTLTNLPVANITGTVADGTTTSAASGIGYMGIPRSAAATTGSYTLTAADAGEHIYTTTTRTITIPGNTTGTGPVAFPIGTTIVFINDTGVTLTIQMQATATDTCILSGVGTSITGGSATPRTLAAFGMATLVKVTSTTWFISGNGLT